MNTLSYRTVSANSRTADKQWVLIDADQEVLGRVASVAAKFLRGKYKTSYTPHVDCGDNVIIINAEKVKLTGNKMTDKVYVRHTGYPGGQRFATPKELLQGDPVREASKVKVGGVHRRQIRVIEHAVKGMLPKNKLGAKLFNNLKVYVGSEHPHEANQPRVIKLNEIK